MSAAKHVVVAMRAASGYSGRAKLGPLPTPTGVPERALAGMVPVIVWVAASKCVLVANIHAAPFQYVMTMLLVKDGSVRLTVTYTSGPNVVPVGGRTWTSK